MFVVDVGGDVFDDVRFNDAMNRLMKTELDTGTATILSNRPSQGAVPAVAFGRLAADATSIYGMLSGVNGISTKVWKIGK